MNPLRAQANVADALTTLMDALWDVRDTSGGLTGLAWGARQGAAPAEVEAPPLYAVLMAVADLAEAVNDVRSQAALAVAVDRAMASVDTT